MKYIYHNTQTNDLKYYDNHRKYNGIVQLPWVELIYTTTPRPDYNADTQRLKQGEWLIKEGKYIQTWVTEDLTDYEIKMKDWLYPHRNFKIKAPKHLARTMPEMFAWFQINKFEIDTDTDVYFAYVYVDKVLEEDMHLLDWPAITLFEKPKIQDYD